MVIGVVASETKEVNDDNERTLKRIGSNRSRRHKNISGAHNPYLQLGQVSKGRNISQRRITADVEVLQGMSTLEI